MANPTYLKIQWSVWSCREHSSSSWTGFSTVLEVKNCIDCSVLAKRVGCRRQSFPPFTFSPLRGSFPQSQCLRFGNGCLVWDLIAQSGRHGDNFIQVLSFLATCTRTSHVDDRKTNSFACPRCSRVSTAWGDVQHGVLINWEGRAASYKSQCKS